ncbi:uncharacterized protein [Maniola hyperantus]|uniref:uncharacterized protein n=1 Tax=Aphantopus hyperantus TaxID=2795564 RepID=UPI00374913F8
MPFTTHPPDLGESLTLATKRLASLEKKFDKDSVLHEKYNEFMLDYLQQGHMEPVPLPEIQKSNQLCYIPHHPVINEQHLTTKLRVVYDSSAKTSNHKSLNDNLMVGPALQNDLRDVTLRWRRHRIALVGDIRQMYRMISKDKRDRNYLRILWRFNVNDPIQHYRLTTVTYGTSCAPYLAIKTLKQLAEDERSNFNDEVADRVLQDFYIDDLLTGDNTLNKVIDLKEDITKLLQKGGFTLHKWASNSPDIEEAEQSTRKILGIIWNGHTDKFEAKIELPPIKEPVTKRTILRDIAMIYDPSGWLAPVVIVAKTMLQKLWMEKIDWDDSLPQPLLQEWTKFRQELTDMPPTEIDRWLGITEDIHSIQLHGFSDASSIAYSSVVYLRVITTHSDSHTIGV